MPLNWPFRPGDTDPASGESVEPTAMIDAIVAVDQRLILALDVLSVGVVIYDDRRVEVHRNRVAESFAGARHGKALVEQVVREVADAAALRQAVGELAADPVQRAALGERARRVVEAQRGALARTAQVIVAHLK